MFRPVSPEHNAKLWRGQTAGSESYPVTANGIVLYMVRAMGSCTPLTWHQKHRLGHINSAALSKPAPAISDGILYAASGDGSVYAFTNAGEVANLTNRNQATDTRQTGIVAHDTAPVYANKEGRSVLLNLNDGGPSVDCANFGRINAECAYGIRRV